MLTIVFPILHPSKTINKYMRTRLPPQFLSTNIEYNQTANNIYNNAPTIFYYIYSFIFIASFYVYMLIDYLLES